MEVRSGGAVYNSESALGLREPSRADGIKVPNVDGRGDLHRQSGESNTNFSKTVVRNHIAK